MGAQDQRPRFYEGQYLAAEDLAAIVEYLRAADARHALGAHTWGIAIGLYLVERPAPGAADRKEIILLPGVAWDGFGRAIVVTRPTRLPEELFASIPYDEHLDGTDPKGRAVRVWLNYSEIAARQPAPGFESCSAEDQNARIAETFEFVVGAIPAGPNRQGNVVVGTETLPAEEALSRFDSSAAPLYDSSVPHQTFPSGKRPPRWLIPIGLVRWVARDGDLGYFVSRDGAPEYRIKDCTRAFRRYIGAVVENLVAADGAIVLQRRDTNPRDRHKLAYLLNCGRAAEELLDDLAWIEGNLRVVGNAKLAGGKLLMRDADGLDEGVPIYLDRSGDDPTLETKKCCEDLDAAAGAEAPDTAALAKKPRELRAAIGSKGQNAHRFIVGPEVPPDAAKGEKAPSLAPRFVVLSGTGEKDDKDTEGRVGINTRDPNAALEVKGDWNGQDGAIRVSGTQPTIRYEGGTDVGDAKWIAQLTATPKGAYRIAYRTSAPAWKGVVNVLPEKVGIRSDNPSAPLTVRADGDAEDLVAFEDKGGAAKWKIRLKPDDHTGLTFTEVSGNKNSLFLKPGGDVGIGTTDPQGRLTVHGKVQPAQGQLSFFTATADVEYDGGNDGTFIFKDTGGKTAFIDTKLGIGTNDPRSRLEVSGASDIWGTAAFVPDPAKGSSISHVHWDTTGDWYIRSAASNGRVILQDTGGNVGIGTAGPQEKLHVNGNFIRVDGAGNEQAYIGGDGSTNLYGQDVQIGSTKSGLTEVHLWNRGHGDWMWLTCMDVDAMSDARHKTDIEPLSGALDQVMRLRGVRFKWKQPPGSEAPPRPGIGVIAQEVAQVAPELVRSVRGDLAVSYNKLVPMLIEAVKELKSEVDELREQVRALAHPEPKKERKESKGKGQKPFEEE